MICHILTLCPSVFFFIRPIFFFSSRRRHTRCLSDWSSDVCSSDLPLSPSIDCTTGWVLHYSGRQDDAEREIGRASCRERGWRWCVGLSGDKKVIECEEYSLDWRCGLCAFDYSD